MLGDHNFFILSLGMVNMEKPQKKYHVFAYNLDEVVRFIEEKYSVKFRPDINEEGKDIWNIFMDHGYVQKGGSSWFRWYEVWEDFKNDKEGNTYFFLKALRDEGFLDNEGDADEEQLVFNYYSDW